MREDQVSDTTAEARNISLSELEQQQTSGGAIFGGSLGLIRGVKVRLGVSVGKGELTIGELMSLKENSVLTLDKAIDEPVEVYLEDKLVAKGNLVAIGDNFGVSITEIQKITA